MSSDTSIRFRTKEMLEHYERFDLVSFKYDIPAMVNGILGWKKSELDLSQLLTVEEIKAWSNRSPKKNSERFEKLLTRRLTNYLRHYDAANDLTSLTKRDFSHVMANLYMIYYADWDKIKGQAQLIDLVSKRVISEYIGIDGLERLFSDQYIDFEWEMHLGMDHSEYKMDFYRDHFIHQVRDAYMMEMLLEEDKLYKPTLDILTCSSASKVSQYFCTMIERQRQAGVSAPIDKFLQFDKDFIPRNMIKMAAFMAGLFHDIGYPETHLRGLQHRFARYMPSIAAMNRLKTTIDDRFSLLQNSLLFRVVPLQEIQARVNRKKVDHGTLSALSFLLHFYENGIIFKLEPYKAAAIELAALAIYNHTYKYEVAEKSSKRADDSRPRFVSNPISYLLRICDDLQEWDRVYFEISSRSNILICPKCRTALIGKKGDRAEEPHRYVCACTPPDDKGYSQFERAFDGIDGFYYRRVYNVSVCDDVIFEPLKKDAACLNWGDASDTVVHVNYDPYRLLHIAYISPGYARYRIKELSKLKLLLLRQSPLPRFWLDYFVTSNPILIKTKLLGVFFENDENEYQVSVLAKEADEVAIRQFWESELNKLTGYTDPLIDDLFSEGESREYVKKAVGLYTRLYLFAALHLAKRKKPNHPAWEKAYTNLADTISEEYQGSEEFRCLLGDSLLQLSRLYPKEVLTEQKYIPTDYLEQFEPGNWKETLGSKADCSSDFYYTAIDRYTNPQRYRSSAPTDEIDAFTDLGFFKILNEKRKESSTA